MQYQIGGWGLRLALVLLLTLPANAAAATLPRLGNEGRWITDDQGRVVIHHGIQQWGPNTPLPGPLPFGHPSPAAMGMGDDDARFLADHGFNLMRLSLSYWEHMPGQYDDSYLAGFQDYVRRLERAGVYSLLDMQQAIYGPRFVGGEGFPAWMTYTDGLPIVDAGYPNSYFVNPAMNRAWDNFWANRAGPGGMGLQDRFAAGWRHLAQRFAGETGVLGYDFINEPWPGTDWASCSSPQGCPPGGFDQARLSPLYERLIKAVRSVDRRTLVVYEPNLLFDFGADTTLKDPGVSNAVFAFHTYCLGSLAGSESQPCEVGENLNYENAKRWSATTGDGLIMGEWGGMSNLDGVERLTESADRNLMPWVYWWYGRVAPDPKRGSTDTANAPRFLSRLVRPYPQITAGTPKKIEFDRQTKRFETRYSTTLPGGRPAGSLRTRIFVPRLHYGGAYRVRVAGAELVKAAGTQRIELRACPGAREVSIVVTDQSAVPTPSCAQQANVARPCLPRRLGVSGRRIGPARIDGRASGMLGRYEVRARRGSRIRFCVRGGGRFVMDAPRGRIAAVGTSARGHATRKTAPGRRAGRLRGAQRLRRGLLLGTRTRRPGRVAYGLRGRRIRFLAVVANRHASSPARVKRQLRRLGLR